MSRGAYSHFPQESKKPVFWEYWWTTIYKLLADRYIELEEEQSISEPVNVYFNIATRLNELEISSQQLRWYLAIPSLERNSELCEISSFEDISVETASLVCNRDDMADS